MSRDSITPLPGEDAIPALSQQRGNPATRKILAAAIMLISLVAVGGFIVTRVLAPKPADAPTSKEDVASANVQPLRLDQGTARGFTATTPATSAAEPAAPAGGASPAGTPVPSIQAPVGQGAQAIPVRGYAGGAAPTAHSTAPQRPIVRPGDEGLFVGQDTGQGGRNAVAGASNNPVAVAQENLRRYEGQLGAMVQQLQGMTDRATGRGGVPGEFQPPQGGVEAPIAGSPALFGTMERTATPKVSARLLGDRSLTMPKGTQFMCALKTKVISATSGFVGCQVQRNVFSDDGRVLLVERGSHLDGEYRIVQVRPGVTRIPVLWTRVRTPNGVTVDLDSPGTGELGESGIGGYVDNRWPERLGAALLLSFINDAVQIAVSDKTPDSANTVVLPNTTQAGSKLAEKVLDSTINIPPLIYQNQGSSVGVYVARDVDFSSVYRLEPR